MNIKDPIHSVEKIVKEVHDTTSKYTEPVLSRYPLVFSFLVVFGVGMTLKGFERIIDQIPFLKENPILLLLTGLLVLTFTGSLYKWLNREGRK
ncbi:MAG: hypothetical protein K9M36_01425 [Candidatus Pacebacteria bacterium]|nr:hypothetical protein [Candidatus Paceibacterota bacterium]